MNEGDGIDVQRRQCSVDVSAFQALNDATKLNIGHNVGNRLEKGSLDARLKL